MSTTPHPEQKSFDGHPADAEALAKIIYNLLPPSSHESKPAWEERGNSIMQDFCRDAAKAAISATLADAVKRLEGVSLSELLMTQAEEESKARSKDSGDAWACSIEAVRARLIAALREGEKVQPDPDGWIPHVPGGPMPCGPDELVHVKLRCGLSNDAPTNANVFTWDNLKGKPGEILFWRPARTTPPIPPDLGEVVYETISAKAHFRFSKELCNTVAQSVLAAANHQLAAVKGECQQLRRQLTEEQIKTAKTGKLLGDCSDCSEKLRAQISTLQADKDRMEKERDRMQKALRRIYDDTEGYADGAPDASAHDQLCNNISGIAKSALPSKQPDPELTPTPAVTPPAGFHFCDEVKASSTRGSVVWDESEHQWLLESNAKLCHAKLFACPDAEQPVEEWTLLKSLEASHEAMKTRPLWEQKAASLFLELLIEKTP